MGRAREGGDPLQDAFGHRRGACCPRDVRQACHGCLRLPARTESLYVSGL